MYLHQVLLHQVLLVLALSTPDQPASSCRDVYWDNNLCPSGLYWISTESSPQQVYCDMDTTACGVRGVMRITYLDTSVSDTCPSNLTKYEVNDKTMCGRHNNTISTQPCNSVYYPSEGAYSTVTFVVCSQWWRYICIFMIQQQLNPLMIYLVLPNDRTLVWT